VPGGKLWQVWTTRIANLPAALSFAKTKNRCLAADFLITKFMVRARNVNKIRKRGRPSIAGKPGVQSVLIGVRLPPNLLADLDRWRIELARRAGGNPEGRPEAIRAILEGHFEGARSRELRENARSKTMNNSIGESAKLAGRAIDRVDDQAASSGERAKRKRRLIRGPEEFTDVRARQRRRDKKS
jgi:hypothetical protein